MSEADGSLAARIQALEDRRAIDDLVTAYCLAIDERDLERFLSLFTEDAVLRHEDGVLSLKGLPSIRTYYTERFAGYGVTFHTPHLRMVHAVSEDEATGVVTGHAEMSQGEDLVVAAIRYTDRYRRVEGRWLFAERVLGFWYYMKASELPTGFAGDLRKHYRGVRMPAELPESLATFKAWHPTGSAGTDPS
jgi:uncharacterized protein (TIGR02246 family)